MDWQEVLNSWDVKAEDRKVEFLEKLYDYYGVTSGCYSGLFQRFQNDMVSFCRLVTVENKVPIQNLFTFVAKVELWYTQLFNTCLEITLKSTVNMAVQKSKKNDGQLVTKLVVTWSVMDECIKGTEER